MATYKFNNLNFLKGNTRPSLEKVLKTITDVIGPTGWYISGSYANPMVKTPSDIDIFFESKMFYDNSVAAMSKTAISNVDVYQFTPSGISNNASTFFGGTLNYKVQFVHKYFGPPKDVFKTFDLNVCKRAITPEGKLIVDSTADYDICIAQVNADTFNRFFKYAAYYYSHSKIVSSAKSLIDEYIENSNLVEYYYDKKNFSAPTNQFLLEAAMKHSFCKEYAIEQARVRAPELLL